MFRRLHAAYTDVVCNPFYIPGDHIVSKWVIMKTDGWHWTFACLTNIEVKFSYRKFENVVKGIMSGNS